MISRSESLLFDKLRRLLGDGEDDGCSRRFLGPRLIDFDSEESLSTITSFSEHLIPFGLELKPTSAT